MTTPERAIDLSHHNTVLDWDAVCEAFPLIAYKVTQGTHYRDPTFHAARQAVRERGCVFLPYHYAEPWKNSPGDEVAHLGATLLESAREIEHGANKFLFDNEAGPALDLEWTDNHPWNPPGTSAADRQRARTLWAVDWHAYVRPLMPVRTVQYVGTGFLRHMLGGGAGLPERADLWIKRYFNEPRPDSPGDNQCGNWEGTQTDGGPPFTLYQYGQEKVPGVDGKADVNTLAPEWRARLGVGR